MTGGTGCGGGTCNCNVLDGERRSDGGELLDKSVLPVSSVRLAAAPGQRCLLVGELRCYSTFESRNMITIMEIRGETTKRVHYGVVTQTARMVAQTETIFRFD